MKQRVLASVFIAQPGGMRALAAFTVEPAPGDAAPELLRRVEAEAKRLHPDVENVVTLSISCLPRFCARPRLRAERGRR